MSRTMDFEGTGLVLEGGGLRGVYTSGVLRFFMDRGLIFPYVVGVSMGACNGANYVSRQPERNRIVNIRYVNDRRHISWLRWLAGGELFGMDFLFDTIPSDLVPFDAETYLSSNQRHSEKIDEMVKNGAAFVIRPQTALRVGRVDTRKDRLYAAYDQGYADTEKAFDALRDFLS